MNNIIVIINNNRKNGADALLVLTFHVDEAIIDLVKSIHSSWSIFEFIIKYLFMSIIKHSMLRLVLF